MKNDTTKAGWRNPESSPVYQCPQCQTRWLIIGVEARHTCNACGHAFDPVDAKLDIDALGSQVLDSWSDAA